MLGYGEAFLDVLAEVVDRFNWLCHAYCLVGNHYHMLLHTPWRFVYVRLGWRYSGRWTRACTGLALVHPDRVALLGAQRDCGELFFGAV